VCSSDLFKIALAFSLKSIYDMHINCLKQFEVYLVSSNKGFKKMETKEKKFTRRKTVLSVDSKVLDQLKIIKRETGCTYNELISCLLYNIGVHQGFLCLPRPLSFLAFKSYVKESRKQKKMQLNR
jgi:hypothetical protein